jgi:ABC-type multidrug transport system fused ATPase/permease subunit
LKQIISKINYLLTKKQKAFALIIFFLLILAILFEFLSIGLLVPLTTGLLGSDSNATNGGGLLNHILSKIFQNIFTDWKNIKKVVILFISFNVLKAFFSIYNVYLQTKFSQNLCLDLSEKLYKRYLNQGYIFHLKNNSARLLRNIQTEINQFNYLITSSILLFSETSIIMGIVITLLILNPFLILSLIVFFGIFSTIFYRLTKKHIITWGQERQVIEEKINISLLQGFGGIKEIIQMDKADYFINEYEIHIRKKNNIAIWTLFLQQIPRYFLEFVFLIAVFFLFSYIQFTSNDMNSFISLFGVLTFSAFRFLPSINKIMSAIVAIRFSKPSVDILYNEFNLSCIRNSEINSNKISFTKQIRLANIKFYYNLNSEKATIDIDNLIIKKGEIIGFFGKSGSGKSTLIDVLMGVLHPTHGSILVDDINIIDKLHLWHKHIGYVPQSVFLLDKSIKNNIAFGILDCDIDVNKVIKALELANLGDYDKIFPYGYETIVGERGTSISGGQMQRIAIARALYNNPDILIFDESTSALDKETESELLITIKELALTKTIIIVSHNIAPLQICNRVYKIEEGKIMANKSTIIS